MRLGLRTALVAMGLTLAAHGAQASIVGLKLQVDAGGSMGVGTADYQTDKDFFQLMRGGAFGAKVEVNALGFLDAFVEHQQFAGSGGLKGSWSQIMAGTQFDFPLSANGKFRGGVGMAIGFGIGTLQPVNPPLDKAQIETKGFVGQASIDLDQEIAKHVRFGLTVPIAYHYLFQGSKPANDPTSQSQGMHAMALLNLKFVFDL